MLKFSGVPMVSVQKPKLSLYSRIRLPGHQPEGATQGEISSVAALKPGRDLKRHVVVASKLRTQVLEVGHIHKLQIPYLQCFVSVVPFIPGHHEVLRFFGVYLQPQSAFCS